MRLTRIIKQAAYTATVMPADTGYELTNITVNGIHVSFEEDSGTVRVFASVFAGLNLGVGSCPMPFTFMKGTESVTVSETLTITYKQ